MSSNRPSGTSTKDNNDLESPGLPPLHDHEEDGDDGFSTLPSSSTKNMRHALPGQQPPGHHIQLRLGKWWTGPAIPLRPELFAISLVYLVQGLLGLSRLAVFTFFKDDLRLDPATVALLTGLGMAPWVVKPLYGFLSDSVPLWGYRRRSYLVLCGGLGAVSWVAMAGPVDSAISALTALVLGSMTTACADVVADSIVVELSRGEPQSTAGSLQSMCWASASMGGILSAYFSGSLVQEYGPRPVFLITAAFPLLVALAAATIPEQRIIAASAAPPPAQTHAHHTNRLGTGMLRRALLSPGTGGLESLKAQGVALWAAITQPQILLPTLFVFMWQATPSADTAMLFFETNHLGFTTEFLGRIRLVASVASLLGVGIYNFYLKSTPLRSMFWWTALIGTGLGMTQLVLITGLNRQWGLSDEIFALGDSALLTVLGQVSFMPVLVLAARLCPEGVEATLFATLMSVLNGGAFVGSALGSGLTKMFGVTSTDFTNLAPLVALCTMSGVAPLLLLGMLPPDGAADAESRPKTYSKKKDSSE